MKSSSLKKTILFTTIMFYGIINAQVIKIPKPLKLSQLTESERNNKIEEIAFQAIRDNIKQIKTIFYPNDPENLPRIDLEPGSNYLRRENIEKKTLTAEHIVSTRKVYEQLITERSLNPGDILYIAKFTSSKYLVWPIVYSVLLFDNGKPVSIGFENDYYFLNIYKNNTLILSPATPLFHE